jgi:hypothetical protein
VPADEPHEYAFDCWCLPVWESYIEAFGSGATITTPWTAGYVDGSSRSLPKKRSAQLPTLKIKIKSALDPQSFIWGPPVLMSA